MVWNKLELDGEMVTKRYADLKCVKDVAKAFNCSITPVRRILKENKISIKYDVHKCPKKLEAKRIQMKGNKLGLSCKHTEEFKAKLSKERTGNGNPQYGNKKELCPNWKGGITDFNMQIRTLLEYKTWRNLCFEQDNYTCQGCKKFGGDLEVHHKISFSNILGVNSITTVEEAIKCKDLWDINNGITYCKLCHSKVDKYRRI